MTWNTTKGPRRIATLALSIIVGSWVSMAALAQIAVLAPTSPEDVTADSAAAMKDTVHDSRIADAQSGEKGIWKWVVPPVKMNGAFDDHDPLGVAIGKLIPADCSINWTDPDTHQLFCFTSATSLVYFLDAPKTNEARAEKEWRDLKKTPTG